MADVIGEAFVAIRPDLTGLEGEIVSEVSSITAELNVSIDPNQLQLDLNAAIEEVPPVDVAANTDEAAAAVGALLDEATSEASLIVDADVTGAEDAIAGVVNSTSDQVNIIVNADTSLAMDEVDSFVSSAESTPVEIPVTANIGTGAEEGAGGVETLNKGIETLHASTEVLAGSAAGLTGLLHHLGPEAAVAAGGIAAITAGTKELFEAGLDAISAEERFDRLLGEQAEAIQNIDVGTLKTNLFTLGQEFGSTKAEVQNTSTTLFEFAKNAGASDEASSQFVDQVSALSARAIALNPQLGTMADVAGTLGIRLARGGRFASSFGVSLTAAEINARALSDTGKETSSQLTLYEKAAAAATLATEKYGDSIGKDVEEGSKNATVQLSALKAEFHDAIEEIGAPLVAPIIEILHDAVGPGEQVGEIFADLARIALPLLDAALHAIEGPLGIVVDIVDAASVPLEVLANLIDSIPEPVLNAAAATTAFVAAGVLLPGVLEAIGFALLNFTIGLETAGTALAVTQPELVAIGLAVGAATALWSAFSGDSSNNTAAIDDMTSALADQNGVLDLSLQKVQAYVNSSSDIGKDPAQVKALNDLGLKFSDLNNLTDHGRDSQQRLIDAAVAHGQAVEQETRGLDNVIEVNGRLFQVNDDGTRNLIENYKKLTNTALDSAKAQLETGVATGQLNEQQVQQLEDTNNLTDGGADYVKVLQIVKPQLDAAGQAEADRTKKEQDAAKATADAAAATQEQQDTLKQVLETSPGIRLAYDGIGNSVDGLQDDFLGLAIQIGDSRLTKDQLESIAVGLGVTVEQLQEFVDGVTKAIDDMTTSATSKLPQTADAFDNIIQFVGKIPDAFNPKNIIDAMQAQIKAIQEFSDNLDFLAFSGLPNLVKEAAAKGPEFTAAIVKTVKEGGPDVGHAMDGSLAFATAAASNFATHFHDDIAPQLALSLGVVGKEMTDAFGQTFKIEAPTQAELDQAKVVAQLANVPLADALRTVAGSGKVAYEQIMGELPGSTQATIDGVKTTLDANTGTVQAGGEGLGGAGSEGFGTGIGGIRPQATSIPAAIFEELTSKDATDTVKLATNVLATDLISGLVEGIDAESSHNATNAAMKRLIDDMLDKGREAADAHSPSRAMMDLGRDMGDGLVIGLESTAPAVNSAITNLTRAASIPIRNQLTLGEATSAARAAVNAQPTHVDNRKTFNIVAHDPFVAAAEVIRKDRAASREFELQ